MVRDVKIDPERAKRLKKARLKAGYNTAEAFAKTVRIPEPTYRSYENGNRNVTLNVARKCAPLLRVGWRWIIDGTEETESALGEYEHVNEYDVSGSAGHGTVISEENVKYKVAFRSDWLRSLTRTQTDKLAVIKVSGDSMEPTLSSGDTLLLDTTQNKPTKDGVYFLQFEGDGLIKRLQYNPQKKSVRVISDNEKYPPIEITNPSSFKIIGRALWAGRKL